MGMPPATEGHSRPHAPQLFTSVCSETHVEPQSVWRAGQLPEHEPDTHVGVPPPVTAGHACPQTPQLFTSVCSETHVEPQSVRPPEHAE
jgi:hypothetical protein